MKNRKLLAIVLCVVMIVTQFTMLGVSAATTALSGREDFLKGINIHPSKNYNAPYTSTYKMILEAKALGSNIIRTNFNTEENHAYDLGVAELALKNGMQVWMTSSFDFYNHENNQPIPASEIDVAGITAKYTNAATVLKNKVAYYQLGNEMNIEMHTGSKNGLTADQFADCSGIAVAIYAANKAIKDVDPKAKTVVNFSWQHMGFIDAIKSVKLDPDTGLPTDSTTNYVNADWDIIGLNWYSDGKSDDYRENGWFGAPIDYKYIIESLNSKYPDMPVVVSETGLWPVENADGTVGYRENAEWLGEFLKYCYSNEDGVLGFIPYELYDQDSRSYDADGNYVYTNEAYHGLMKNDGTKKDVYNTICSLYGGTGVVDRTIPDAPAMNNKGELLAVYNEGVTSGKISTLYNGSDWISVETAVPFAVNQGDLIEFDLYVEDVQAMTTAMEKNDLNLMVRVYDNAEGIRDCRYITKEYLVADGWNHIVIAANSFFDGKCDLANITKLSVQFYGSESVIESYTELSGMNVAIANICSTDVVTPENEITASKIVIDEAGYGMPANRYTNYIASYDGKILDKAVDTVLYDTIEFDFYVENYELFKEITVTKGYDVMLRLLNNKDGSSQHRYYLSQYVTKQGWNHIVIKIDKYDRHTGSAWNNQFARYRLGYKADDGVEIPYPSLYLEFRNFNAIAADFAAAPELPENVIASSSNTVIRTYGSNSSNIRKTTTLLKNPLDLSKADYIEFDVYVENVEHFKAFQSGHLGSTSGNHTFVFYLSPSDAEPELPSGQEKNYIQDSNRKQVFVHFAHILDQFKVDGWNHIKVPVSEMRTGAGAGNFGTPLAEVTDASSYLSNIKRVGFYSGRSSADAGKFYPNEYFGFANVCGTVEEWSIAPELPDNIDVIITEGLIKAQYGLDVNINKSDSLDVRKVIDPVDVSNSDYIECDIYVSDLDNFNKYATTDSEKLCLILYTGDGGLKKVAFYKITEELLIQGWNHLKFDKNAAVIRGDSGAAFEWDNVNKVAFGTYNSSTASFTAKGTAVVANVCGTVPEYKIIPELPEKVIDANTNNVYGVYGTLHSDIKKIKTSFENPLNFANADTIEFDIYIENIEHFKEYINTHVTSDGHKFYFYLETAKKEGSANVRATYKLKDIVPQLKNDGWNHIVIAKDAWGHEDFAGTPDFSSIIGAGWHFSRGNVNSLYTTEHIGFANVCGTGDIEVPTDVMAEKVDFIGAELKPIKFDSLGEYFIDCELDITGTRMIELDIFVSNNAISEITIEIADSNDGYALYYFDNLTSGWNRLAVRLSDGVDEDGNKSTVDLSNIVSYGFYATKNASIIISNFYAADYVEGDGNRDGEVNILDLVRMKKYASDLSGIGNVVAMDVKGNDYEINSLDLMALRVYLLTDKWPEK